MTLLTDPLPAAPAPSSGAPVAAADAKATGKEQLAGAAEPAPVDAAQKTGENTGDAPTGAPETYEFTAPETGAELGVEVLTAYSAIAKELNLTQEAAQKVLDKVAPALKEQSMRHINEMVQGWIDASKADPTIGGPRLQATIAMAQKTLELGPPGLRKLLGPVKDGGTGLGNHPDILAWAAAIGTKLSPDTFVGPGRKGPAAAPVTFAEALYGPSTK